MIQILSGVGLFFLGIMVGAVFHRSFQGEAGKNKRLEQKLAELQDTYSHYQAEVSEHFMDTARAVQTLNKSYRDVHTQLAKGASRLCNDDQANDFLAINFSSNSNKTNTLGIEDEINLAPPMDYAPKQTPDAEGTLSEGFGLKDGVLPDDNNVSENINSNDPDKNGESLKPDQEALPESDTTTETKN